MLCQLSYFKMESSESAMSLESPEITLNSPDIIDITNIIKKCCIEIAACIREGDSDSFGKLMNQKNASSDEVKKLDLMANSILKHKLLGCSYIRTIGSEEETELVSTKFANAPYLVCFDPLDGSSNIDVNITVGTIFAIYQYDSQGKIWDGESIVCAGYCLYGSSTQFIVADNKHVEMYHLFDGKDFVLSNPNVRIPNKGNIYAINESNKHRWLDKELHRDLTNAFIKQGKTMRWVGSLVADAHRTLMKGGYFSYFGTDSYPNGKLRLLYELYPIGFIFDAAGGNSHGRYTPDDTPNIDYAQGGYRNILQAPFPTNIHQKAECAFCSPSEAVVFMAVL